MLEVVFCVGAVLAAWLLTGTVRRHAIANQLLAIPNARSSHIKAVPVGGGIAIAVVSLTGFVALGSLGRVAWSNVWSLCVGGALVALIGFVDDRSHVRPLWRLVTHVVAGCTALYSLGSPHSAPSIVIGASMTGVAVALSVLYIVWLINLTNFMDGIDGIAGVEAVTMSGGLALLSYIAAPGAHISAAPALFASATLGFLIWNWPPAKIFMGDVGSGFLGITVAVLSLQAGQATPRLFWSSVIMLGVFIVDATLTLVRRVLRGERFYEAHRDHAYQHGASRPQLHAYVTLAVAAVNLAWLFPIAALVAFGRLDGLTGVLISFAPLVLVALRLKAGVRGTR